jgi:hypothetical protein
MLPNSRQFFDDGLLVFQLRIQHPQRIRLNPPLAVRA